MTAEEGKELLRIARTSIEERLVRGRAGFPVPQSSQPFAGPQGAFVTIHTYPQKRLRGCIGRIESEWPLPETVSRMAVAAAVSDPRFHPMESSELPAVILKVSVMSPLEKVGDSSRVVIGRHGVVVKAHGRTGVFLPEVPVEQGWTSVQMLDHLCREKMGLDAGSWREPGAEIFVFESEGFEEKEPGKV